MNQFLPRSVPLIGLLVLIPSVHAGVVVVPSDPLVTYGAALGNEFAPTLRRGGLQADPLNAIGSRATLEVGERLPDAVFLDIEVLSTGPAAAVANDQYFQFTVSPLPGNSFSLTSLSFLAARGADSQPRGWVLRSSIDSYSTDLGSGAIPTTQPVLTSYDVSLGPAFHDLTDPLTMRLYGYAPSFNGVGIYFDELTVFGSVIPEPGIPALLVALLPVCLCRRRRVATRR